MRTSIKIFVVVTTLAFTVFLFHPETQKSRVDIEDVAQTPSAPTAIPEKNVPHVVPPNVPPTASTSTFPTAHTEPAITTSITLPTATVTIDGKVFDVPVHADENVYDIMNTLKSEGALSFTAREYAGMGTMLLSINGKPSNGDMTWIFYVNGKESQKGVSSVKVSSGDVIDWKYEKSY